MTVDPLTEWMTGSEEAVTVIGKVLVYAIGKYRKSILLAGAVVVAENPEADLVQNPTQEDEQIELWDVEITLKPRRKLTGYRRGRGFRVDQILTAGFKRPEMWEKEIWRAKDCTLPVFAEK